MPDKDTGMDLDKFFDSLDGDNDDVDTELAKALADQAENDADDDNDTKTNGDDQTSADDDQKSTDQLSVAERLALLEKENKGLKKDIVKVRSDRRSAKEEIQEARDRYNRLHGMIEQMAKGGSQTDEQTGGTKEDSLKDLKLAVQYDDDGNPYVPADALAEIIKGQDQKLEKTREEMLQDKQKEEAQRALDNTIKSIVSQDESYPSAFTTVEKALADMNRRVIEIQQEKNLKGILQPGRALDLLEQEGALEEWQEAFPGLDPDIIVNAFQSERQLKKALTYVSKLTTQTDDSDTSNKAKKSLNDAALVDKLSKKPSSHGKGAVDAKDSIVAKVGSSSSEDILNLSDKDVNRLLERMRQEELASY